MAKYQAEKLRAEQEAKGLAEQDRASMLDLSEGQYRESMADPYLESSLGAIEGGMEGPYTDEVKAGLLAQINDQSAAAERAALGSLRRSQVASGGSMADPSAQAAQRRALANRQTQVQGATTGVNMQAAMENYSARQQAAQRLADVRLGQRRTAQPLAQQASQQYQNTVRDVETPQAPQPTATRTRPAGTWQQQINQSGIKRNLGGPLG
jgi:hypothetical protein